MNYNRMSTPSQSSPARNIKKGKKENDGEIKTFHPFNFSCHPSSQNQCRGTLKEYMIGACISWYHSLGRPTLVSASEKGEAGYCGVLASASAAEIPAEFRESRSK